MPWANSTLIFFRARSLESGKRAAAVHSFLGNGKTLFCQGMAFTANKNRFAVYEFDRERQAFARECELIKRSTSPTLVIIEDYHRNFELIERLATPPNPFLHFLFTSRTPIHLMNWERLNAVVGQFGLAEISVDKLRPDEVVHLDAIFERYGLLGAEARLGKEARVKRLNQACNAEFRDILLFLLSSPHIREKVNAVLDRLAAKPGVQEVAISVMILRHIGAPSDMQMLAELTGVERLNRALFARDSDIGELASVGSDNIIAKSPLFAAQVLRSFWHSGRVVKVLSEMLQRALALRNDEPCV